MATAKSIEDWLAEKLDPSDRINIPSVMDVFRAQWILSIDQLKHLDDLEVTLARTSCGMMTWLFRGRGCILLIVDFDHV